MSRSTCLDCGVAIEQTRNNKRLRCEACGKDRRRERWQRPEVKKWNRERWQRPEFRERVREWLLRPEVKERRRVWGREYRLRPGVKERIRERNRERHRLVGSKSRRFIAAIAARDGGYICGRDGFPWGCGSLVPLAAIHVDHIIPQSKGGQTELDNLQILCAPCNVRKQDKVDKEDITRIKKRRKRND